MAYIWVGNVHPYTNGNRRTARLFADSILMGDGYLPICFETQVGGHVVKGYAQRELILENSVLRCLKAVERSYRIILDGNL
ncbi:MAG: hypothetical protein H7318_10040 [Oligoflexus sp.]|nr:hypothetical protein [Oligoflexus sp.]